MQSRISYLVNAILDLSQINFILGSEVTQYQCIAYCIVNKAMCSHPLKTVSDFRLIITLLTVASNYLFCYISYVSVLRSGDHSGSFPPSEVVSLTSITD